MKESLFELQGLVFVRTFVPVAVILLLLASVGGGVWRPRWKRLVWAVSLAAVISLFAIGVLPHGERGREWSEVLFNGQLL
jgi:hypothetical protein